MWNHLYKNLCSILSWRMWHVYIIGADVISLLQYRNCGRSVGTNWCVSSGQYMYIRFHSLPITQTRGSFEFTYHTFDGEVENCSKYNFSFHCFIIKLASLLHVTSHISRILHCHSIVWIILYNLDSCYFQLYNNGT